MIVAVYVVVVVFVNIILLYREAHLLISKNYVRHSATISHVVFNLVNLNFAYSITRLSRTRTVFVSTSTCTYLLSHKGQAKTTTQLMMLAEKQEYFLGVNVGTDVWG